MSAASHLLPFLSMLACVSVKIHHTSLGVDQGENTPPHSASSSSSCPHLTLMAVGFLMRKWVSLCNVSVEGLQKWGTEGKGEGEEMYWCKTHPPAEKLKSQPSRVGPRRGGALSVNIAMPSFSFQRAKQANCSILPLTLSLPCKQVVCIMIIDVPV